MDIKTKILNEAAALFYRMGIRSVTMDLLAEHLGISKRTIYENFKDKNEIVMQSLLKGFNEYNLDISRIVNEAPNVLEGIYKVGQKNHEVFSKINSVFLHDLKKYHGDVFNVLIKKGGTTNSDMNLLLLKRGQNEGIFKKELNIELVNVLLNHIMEWSHSENMNVFIQYGKEDFYKSIVKPFLIGLCTAKGRELLKTLDNINDD